MNKAYTKFIVLSEPRSGTHMLRSLLAHHPRAICLAEMFNPHWNLEAPFADDTPTRVLLDQYVWTPAPPGIGAIGFTIHRRNAPLGDRDDVWDVLAREPGLRVVFLRRENLLERYLSFRTLKEDKGGAPTPKLMTAAELHEDFKASEQCYEQFRTRFAHCPGLEVTYESLCSGQAEVNRILEFLGLQQRALEPGTRKNTPRRLCDAIVPFTSLAREFRGTAYYRFFEPHMLLASAAGSADLGDPG